MIVEELINEYRPEKNSKVIFVTGKLAAKGLQRVLEAINPQDFTYKIRVLDVEVAAWLDVSIIYKQIGDIEGVNVLIIPGKTTGDEQELQEKLHIQVVRGPNCYSELPVFLEEIGFESDSAERVVPPKIIVLDDKHGIAEYLAKTYEIKLIDPITLAKKEKIDASKHNQVAELVRSETITLDGWVLKNYPDTMRDIECIKDMKLSPDAVVSISNDSEVAKFYSNKPQYIYLGDILDSEQIRKKALVKVEMLMQTCINPDEGLADGKEK